MTSLQHENKWIVEQLSPTITTVKTKTGLLSSLRNQSHVNATLNWDVCLEGANQQIQNWTDYWYSQKYAIFATATAAPHRSGYSATTFRNQTWMYHLTFTSFRGQGGYKEAAFVRNVFQVRGGRQWYCIDQNQSRVRAKVPIPFHGHAVTVMCPTSMELHRIEAKIHSKVQETYSLPPVVSYHVQPHVDCARQRMHTQQQQQQQQQQHPPPNIVACPLIKGNVPRTILLEWIEYHRMIGIEHFMVYLHEPYRSNLPNLSYVEYIPFDVEGEVVQKAVFLFQLSQQHDCLARARALGSKWVATHDVDEYIHVVALPTNSTAPVESTGPDLLLSILEKTVAEKPSIGVVLLMEAHFGQLFPEQGTLANGTAGLDGVNSPPSLVMDYVYRGPLQETGGKVIMRPENVKYTSVHSVVSGGPNEPIDPSVVRLNHYHRPQLPPHGKSRDLLDTSLRDGYRDRLAERLKELNSTQ